jgi:hypothetical protein
MLHSVATTAAFVSIGFAVACSSSSPPSGFGVPPTTSDADGGSASVDDGNGDGPSFSRLQDGGASTEAGVDTKGYNAPTTLGCSERAQQILILDFRSGWWAGGGGGSFSSVALPAVVGACPSTSADYHHLENQFHVKCTYTSGSGGGCKTLAAATTVADIRASFDLASVDDYTQIWVLSGSDQDPTDIPVGAALFQGVLGDTKGACIPMLIAAGDGFVTHANTVTQDLGMGEVFTEETTPPSFLSVAMSGAKASSSISGTNLKPSHVLFTGVTSIVDRVTGQHQAKGDSLAAALPAPNVYDVLAHDGSGKGTIAVGASKLSGDGYRPFIFDAGWQRMYALGQDTGTDQYLKNIVMYLSLVGCKAAPIGPVR